MNGLPTHVTQGIDKLLAMYPAERRQSAIISALMLAQQNNNGFLSEVLIEQVADYVGVNHIVAYEVASFYSMFDLKMVGRHKISLCTNISCMLRGSDEIASYLKNKLGIEFGQTSADGKFSLQKVECLAACGGAPVMQLDNRYCENLSKESIDAILQECD